MNNQSGISHIFRYRKLYIIALVLGAVIGGVLTFFIPKKYLSTAIVYPYNSHTVSSIVSNPQFGYEVETEQLLQLLESKSMRDRTIEKFKLYDYYEEDTTEKAWRSDLSIKYIKDVTFFRSKYLSVVINVETKDPQLSADIANYQVAEVNKYREKIFEENRYAGFRNIKEKYELSLSRMNSLKDSIYEVKKGSGQLLYNFIENLNNENYDASEFVNDPRLEKLVDNYLYEKKRFDGLRVQYDQHKQALDEDLPSIYSIDVAEPSYKKASPSYFMNILIGGLAFFVITLTFRLVLDKWKLLKSSDLK